MKRNQKNARRSKNVGVVDNFYWHQDTCKTCGKTFILTQDEIEKYIERGQQLPKNCKKCISQRRQQQARRESYTY